MQSTATLDTAGWSSAARVYSKVEYLILPFIEKLAERAQAIQDLNNSEAKAMDNGCGTGLTSAVLKQHYVSLPVHAYDISEGMVEIIKSRAAHSDWTSFTAQVLDGRNLIGIADDTFTHTFSTFMICLAPDPDLIAKEMYRVTRKNGVLGLAVWGEPYFAPFNDPWTKACRKWIPDYEPVQVMGSAWTCIEEVKAGLERAGFRDVDIQEKSGPWTWENVDVMSKYFFDGKNPGNDAMISSFREQGGNIDKIKSTFEQIFKEDYAGQGESLEGTVLTCLATARK